MAMLTGLIERILGSVMRGTNLRWDAETRLLGQPTRPPRWIASRPAQTASLYNNNASGHGLAELKPSTTE